MQLIFLPGFLDVDLDVVSIVDLFLYIFIYADMISGLSVILLCSVLILLVVIFSQFDKVLLGEVLDGDLVIQDVHGGVLHDGLDSPLLGELD